MLILVAGLRPLPPEELAAAQAADGDSDTSELAGGLAPSAVVPDQGGPGDGIPDPAGEADIVDVPDAGGLKELRVETTSFAEGRAWVYDHVPAGHRVAYLRTSTE